ncbi:MAG: hypothetical protein NUW23_08690 [Firmicutes bacterium]|nr:hypothetical protein [Bacillota bacterium]
MNLWGSSAAGDPESDLLKLALSDGRQVVGVVGLAKNCGKTTVLNGLIRAAKHAGIPVGVTSCGRDGEPVDAITGLPKPSVVVPAGAFVAMAESTVGQTACSLEIVERLGVHTTAGEVVVAKPGVAGAVEIIGCNHASDLAKARDAMLALGARLVLVDGAAGRAFHASPDVVDGLILSTGAALDGDLQEVVSNTSRALLTLRLPLPPPRLAELAAPVIRAGETGIVRKSGLVDLFQRKTVLGHEAELCGMIRPGDLAYVTGKSVGDSLLREIVRLARGQATTVVASDPTRVTASQDAISEFEAGGGTLSVLGRAPVIAVTVNPASPWGRKFDPVSLILAVSGCPGAEGLKVFDVVAGLCAQGGVLSEAQP